MINLHPTTFALPAVAWAMILFSGCTTVPVQALAPPLAVTVLTTATGTVERSVVAVGHVIPRQVEVVAADIATRITAIPVDVGESYATGAILVESDTRQVQLHLDQATADVERSLATQEQCTAQVAEAEVALHDAERSLARARQLLAGGLASEENLEQRIVAVTAAGARLRAARAQLAASMAEARRAAAVRAQATLDVDQGRVVAGGPGVVLRRLVEPGTRPEPGMPLLHLVRREAIEISAQIPLRDLAGVAVGHAVTVTRDHGEVRGTVRQIEPEIDSRTRQIPLRIWVPTGEDWHLAESVLVRLVVARETGLCLPVTALRRSQPAQVLVVTEGIAHIREVVLGAIDGRRVIIRSGLAAGDLVVANAPALVEDGQTVTPMVQP